MSDIQIMGIVNVTPDSFSDGGQYDTVEKAIEHGQLLYSQGADILDIGGESTRPGAEPVSIDEEIDRICPVIEGLRGIGAIISIDTRNAKTMDAALNAGATMINDVTALQNDQSKYDIANRAEHICLMHMQGQPQTMQSDPQYDDVVNDIIIFFEQRIQSCIDNGIDAKKLIIDPGIGFGKSLDHNLEILARLTEFQSLKCPILLGTSRKSFIGKIDGSTDPAHRLGGSLASAVWGIQNGASIVRVHDVHETNQAFKVFHSISSVAE